METNSKTPFYPSKKQRRISPKLTLILVLILILVGLGIGGLIGMKNPKPTAFDRFEGIKRVGNLRLVRHTYLQLITFRNAKNDRLEFMIEAPGYVHGQLDMSKLSYTEPSPGHLIVKLPQTVLSPVRIDLENLREITFRGRSLSFGGGPGAYREAFTEIAATIGKARTDIEKSAIANGILEQTEQRAREFVLNQTRPLRVRISFEAAPVSLDTNSQKFELPELKLPKQLKKTFNKK